MQFAGLLYHCCHGPQAGFRAVESIDPKRSRAFQAGPAPPLLGRGDPRRAQGVRPAARPVTATMREFAADSKTRVHPQTVIEHFGSWNAAKRRAGLVPRRFATREELLVLLRELGERARPDADGEGSRRAARLDAVEVALLAHLRLADGRAARGGVRRAGRGGAPRARGRAGRSARAQPRPPAEVRGLGGGPQGRPRRCSPSGRSTACSTGGAAPGRRSSSSSASACVSEGVDVRDGRAAWLAAAAARRAAAIAARRLRQDAASCGPGRRQRRLLVRAVGRGAALADSRPSASARSGPRRTSSRSSVDAQRALDDLERCARGGEEHLVRRRPSQSGRPTPRARKRTSPGGARPARRSPSSRAAPRTRGRPSASSARAKIASESTVISGRSALEAVAGEDLVVVHDDPVVDADHRAVADGVVVGLDRRMALGVVADVDEQLRRLLRNADRVEERARAGALLVDDATLPLGAARVADGVGAALRDSRPAAPAQRASGLIAGDVAEAVSGDSAHMSFVDWLPRRFESLNRCSASNCDDFVCRTQLRPFDPQISLQLIEKPRIPRKGV